MELFKGSKQDYDLICNKLELGELKNDLTVCLKDDNNKIIAGVIYSVVDRICYLSIYTLSPKWCSRVNLSKFFMLPFKTFDIKVVKCSTSHKNKRINKLLRGLNLREEGFLRYARPDASHEVVFSVTLKELTTKRWFKWVE